MKMVSRKELNIISMVVGKEKEYSIGSIVIAHDWIQNSRIVCGNALHLAPTKELSEQWNEGGRLLKCSVFVSDMCVFPYNISQIRCRSVAVLHEVI